jgi:predicted nucleic acid-binding Zn ribbon protein
VIHVERLSPRGYPQEESVPTVNNKPQHKRDPRPSGKPPRPDDPQGRRRVLAQWRGIDMAPREVAWSLRCRPMAHLAARALQGMGLDRKRAEAEIGRVWNQLLDPTITAHAQPTGILRGTLFVTVDSSAWLDEIVRYRYPEILERLQHSFGTELVKRISFRAG